MELDESEIKKRLRKLEKSLPKPKKSKRLLPEKGKAKALFVLRLQAILSVFLFSAFILLTLLPPFLWPVKAPVTSEFLFRLSPDSKSKGIEIHHGIDLGASAGTPIFPAGFGFVQSVGVSPVLGNYAVVNHFLGFSSTYAHMQAVYVKKGFFVFPGVSRIGAVGSTGRSTGPHLHFAISLLGLPLPPRLLLVFHSMRLWMLKF